MITPRAILIIISILMLIVSVIPLLKETNVSISGFSIADKVQDSKLPQSTTPYFAIIFVLALIGVICGLRRRELIVH